jgi:gas vesicle protein
LNIFEKNIFNFKKPNNRKLSNAALLLLTGATIGALAGLLLAPDEGTKTRKKWLKKAKKYKKNVEDKASEYKDKVTDFKDSVEGAAHDLKKRFA